MTTPLFGRDQRFKLPQSGPMLWGTILGVAVLYYGAARLGLLLAFESTNASPIWPPTGIALAALMLGGWRLWPAILLGAFAANFAVFAANHVAPGVTTAWVSLGIASGNTLEALTGVYLLRLAIAAESPFGRPASVFKFAAVVMVACVVSAGMGTASLLTGQLVPIAAWYPVALSWWLGDLGGALIVTPFLLAWLLPREAAGPRVSWWGAIVFSLVVLLVLVVVFGRLGGSQTSQRTLAYLCILCEAWAAWRFGRRGVTLLSLVLTSFAVWETTHGVGVFASSLLNNALVLLVAFVALCGVTGLVLAADLEERRQLRGRAVAWRELLRPWGILLSALLATVLAWNLISTDTESRAASRFELKANEVRARIADRMHDYENMLRGAQGLFAVTPGLNRGQWHEYVQRLALARTLPGTQGIGYARVVAPHERQDLIRAVRAEGFPDYLIYPEGERAQYAAVVYLEPFEGRNLRAFGLDLMFEPVRRAAATRARDTGDISASGKVRLVQETERDVQSGLLMFLPVYRPQVPLPDVNARRDNLVGFVYGVFRMSNLMHGLLGAELDDIGLEVFDGPVVSDDALMFSNLAGRPATSLLAAGLSRTSTVSIAGRDWQLRFVALPAFEKTIDRQKAQLALIAGIVTSLLMFTLVRSLAMSGEHARSMAESMTAALRDSQAKLTTLVESAKEAIIIGDADGCIVSWNPGAQAIFGYDEKEAIGMEIAELMPSEYRDRHRQGLARINAGEPAHVIGQSVDLVGLHKDGRQVALLASLTTWVAQEGRYFGAIIRDVSENERAEAFLRSMFYEAPDAILVVDQDGRIAYANVRATQLFGYAAEELLKLHMDELVPSANRDEHAGLRAAHLQDPQRRDLGTGLDLTALRADGQTVPVDIALTPLQLRGGSLTVATIVDATEARSNRDELRTVEERLRLMIDAVTDYAILTLDANGWVTSWNAGAERIKGYRAEEIIGQHHSRFYLPEDVRQGRPEEMLRLAAELGRFEDEGWRLRKDGSRLWASVLVTALRDKEGTLCGFGKVTRDLTMRREADQALAAESRRLRLAKEAAQIGVWEWDLRSNLLVWDEEMYEIYRIERSSPRTTYLTWRECVMESERERVERLLAEAVATKAPFDAEFRIKWPNEELRVVRARGLLVMDDAGRPIRMVGINWDTTDLRRAEEALRASESRFRGVLENAPIGMAVLSLDGRWLELNLALAHILGYEREALRSIAAREITHPKDHEREQAHALDLISGRERAYQIEKRYVRKDGQTVWARETVALVRDERGEPLYFISQVEDVTEQRAAEARLSETLALQTAILGSADISIIATDPQGIVISFNRAAQTMLGYTAEEVIGVHGLTLFHDRQELEARANQLSQEGLYQAVEPGFKALIAGTRDGQADMHEWTYVRRDGGRFPVQQAITPILDSDGTTFGFLSIASDITDRKNKERTISAALADKETLLREVYHRVKNNLQVITSLFNLQLRTLPQGPARLALSEGADRVRAMALVHEKLYQSATLSSLHLQSYITDLSRQLLSTSAAADRGITLVTDIDPLDVGLERAVPLGLLLNELVANSLKHGFVEGQPGQIRISLKQLDEQTARLQVADTGPGFPPGLDVSTAKSLGLKLVVSLSSQLDGTFEMGNRDGAVSTLTFQFTEPVQAKA